LFDEIGFNEQFIKRFDSFKYLGLFIDSKIDWSVHVNSVAAEIAPYVGILRRIRYCVNEKVLMQVYYAYIHSRLSYCLPVWSSCSLELKMRLQRLQNKALKFIRFKPPLTPTSELYGSQFLSFLQLCDFEPILFIHKVTQGLVKCDFELFTNERVTGRQTR
jgi:hypothetical protein